LPLDIYNILHMYSPIRLGIKKANVVPVNMALNDLPKGISWIRLMASCHFRASMPQFTSMSADMIAIINKLSLLNESLICCNENFQFGCRCNCL
jgi:hypothetical protein